MKYQIKPARQVIEFTNNLAPESRVRCRRGLTALENWRGDIIPLQRALAGFHRLRVGRYRFIFAVRDGRVIEVLFAQERDVVYQLFEGILSAGETEPLT